MRLKVWKGCVAAIGGAVTLSACVTNVPFDERLDPYHLYLDKFTGISVDELQSQWGAPQQVVPLSDGRKLWIYTRRRAHHSDGGSTGTTYPNSFEGTYRGADGKPVASGSYTSPSHPDPEPMTWETECETRFVVGPDNKVQRSAFDGAGNGKSRKNQEIGCGAGDIDKK